MDMSIHNISSWQVGSIVFMADRNRTVTEVDFEAETSTTQEPTAQESPAQEPTAQVSTIQASTSATSDTGHTGKPAVVLYRPSLSPKFVVIAMMTPFQQMDEKATDEPWNEGNKNQQQFFIPVEPAVKNPSCPIQLTLQPGINESPSYIRVNDISAVPTNLFQWYRDHGNQRYNLSSESKTLLLSFIQTNAELNYMFLAAKHNADAREEAISGASKANPAVESENRIGAESFEIIRNEALPYRDPPKSPSYSESETSSSEDSSNQDVQMIAGSNGEAELEENQDIEQASEVPSSVLYIDPDNKEDLVQDEIAGLRLEGTHNGEAELEGDQDIEQGSEMSSSVVHVTPDNEEDLAKDESTGLGPEIAHSGHKSKIESSSQEEAGGEVTRTYHTADGQNAAVLDISAGADGNLDEPKAADVETSVVANESIDEQNLADVESSAGANETIDEQHESAVQTSTGVNEAIDERNSADIDTSTEAQAQSPSQVTGADDAIEHPQLQETGVVPVPGAFVADMASAHDLPGPEVIIHVAPVGARGHTYQWTLVVNSFMVFGIWSASRAVDAFGEQYLTSWFAKAAFSILVIVGFGTLATYLGLGNF